MDVEEYNALIARLITGLPATLIISRLNLALLWVVQDTHPSGLEALKRAVELKEAADERLLASVALEQARHKPRP